MLLRDAEDWDVACSELDGIQLVVGCPEIATGITHIESRTDVEQLDRWLLEWVEKGGWQ